MNWGDERLPERFWDKCTPEPNSGCWFWTGAASSGYGSFRVDGKAWTAHRFACQAVRGEIPANKVVDHLCRNTLCVNPRHLEPVSYSENALRGDDMGAFHRNKTACPAGHAYSNENTYRTPRNERVCRECYRGHWRAWYQRKQAS